nr:dienelactone hydrolase family protein [Roseomonas acroporae]
MQSRAPGHEAAIEARLFLPPGPGPHPALVFLHGCGGLFTREGTVNARETDWAARFNAEGVAVLMPDSFGARGTRSMCAPADFDLGLYRARPWDAYAALAFLAARPDIRADRIGLVGWSQGGGAVLLTIREDDEARPAGLARDFRAAVAFYPGSCRPGGLRRPLATRTPLLVLVGEEDAWTPAGPCRTIVEAAAAAGSPVAIHTYPGAVHDFDWPGLPRRARPDFRTGAGIVPVTGMDPAAREDALRRVPEFLLPRLRE